MRPNFLFPGAPAVKLVPPQNFVPAKDPHNVRLIDHTHSPQRLSTSRKAGIRYEQKWHSFYSRLMPGQYRTFEHKLFAFADVSGQRCIRPDGLLIPPESDWFGIFEVKVAHISDSFWQLRHLYEPVLSRWSYLQSRRAVVLEVCRRYDPATVYPCPTRKLSLLDLDDYFARPQNPEEVGVLIWKDK